MEKWVVGFMFRREAFRSCKLYVHLKELNTGKEEVEDIAYDSWTNRNPETLGLKTEYMKYVDGVEFNKPDELGCHRRLVWVKKRVFRNKDEAMKFALDLFQKGKELYEEREREQLKEELEIA